MYVRAGESGDGNEATPFGSVSEAEEAAADGSHIAIASGTYAETVFADGKSLSFWGTCPAEVNIDGGESSAVFVTNPPRGELRDLDVTTTATAKAKDEWKETKRRPLMKNQLSASQARASQAASTGNV